MSLDIEQIYDRYLSCTGVSTDTRSVSAGQLFVALKGGNFNGNQFVGQALAQGAAFAIADEVVDVTDAHRDKVIHVADALATLQALARYHRLQFTCPVLAITGSNGKTTTKELITAVLNRKYRTYSTVGNLNNHIGIPLTLLRIHIDAEMAVIEMGANHQREIAGYCLYAMPDYGLITNIGKAHLEGFGGIEGVLKGKTELYEYLAATAGKVFVHSSNDTLMKRARELFTDPSNIILYGNSGTDRYCGQPAIAQECATVIMRDGTQLQSQLVGGYNADNIMAAVAVGSYFDVPMSDMAIAIADYAPTNNRSQRITRGSNTILLDAYNANPSSMVEALRNFDQIAASHKVVIIGEMMELGAYSTEEHERIATMVMGMDLEERILVGAGFAMMKHKAGVRYFANTKELSTWYQAQDWQHTTQLIKGSRSNALERIVR